MQMAVYPDPVIPGGSITISGKAESTNGVPPTGDVKILVRTQLVHAWHLRCMHGT